MTSRNDSAPQQPSSSARRERRIRCLFGAIPLLFVLQCWFLNTYGEPYPALTLPNFHGARAWTTSADILVTFADGGTAILSPRRLFSDAPSSFVRPMMKIGFGANVERSRVERPAPKRFSLVRSLMPGLTLARSRAQHRLGIEKETQIWFRDRLAALYRDRRAVRSEIVWYKDTFALTGRDVRHHRQETSRVEIPL